MVRKVSAYDSLRIGELQCLKYGLNIQREAALVIDDSDIALGP